MIEVLLNLSLTTLLFLGPGSQPTARNRLARLRAPISQQPVDLTEASRLNDSVFELYRQGKYDEALPLAKRALELEERSAGTSQRRVAVALNNLAKIYLAKKKLDDAEKLFQQALAIYEKDQPQSSLSIAGVLEGLAYLRYQKKDYNGAAALLERSVASKEKTFGNEDARTADALLDLANLYQKERQYEKAEPLYLRSLAIKEKTVGPSDPKTVEAMKNFACANLSNRPIRFGKKLNTDEPLDEKQTIIGRAYCWLGGLQDNCAESFGKSTIKTEGLLNGKAISLVKPEYPASARAARAAGQIFVAVLIDESGKVIKAKAVCGGHSTLAGASVAAALASKFSPTLLNNKPVQVTGMIIYNFVSM